MLNRIMLTQIREVKASSPITPSQEICREFRYKEAEAGSEVEGLPDGGVEVAECDVAPVVREDAVIGEGVEHRACGARVAGAGRDIGGPVACVAGNAGGNDVGRSVGGEEEVEEEEVEVPG